VNIITHLNLKTYLTILGLSLAATTQSNAQGKTWRLGFLTPGSAEAGLPAGTIRNATLGVLSQRGYSEGKNLVYFAAGAEGDSSRLVELAKTLTEQRLDAVIVVGTPAAKAVMTVSPGTPIVLSFAGDDPVNVGIAESLARPGGSVTGIFFRALETDAKRLELLSEALPSARSLGFLAAPTLERERLGLLEQTAAKLGVSLTTRLVRGPEEYASTFQAFQNEGISGVLIMGTAIFAPHASMLSTLASERGIATICEWDHMARAGCTFAFGPNLVALRQLTGDYIARIFNGASPAELPIQQPDRFTLSMNQRAVDSLNLKIPPAHLARVDEVIE
jgi:putative ABC transport system substrate-binding protein